MQECLCDDGRLRLDPDGDPHDQIEAVFGPIYATNIPEFLDWHYTVVGQYTELAMAAAGRLEQEIDSRLFGNLTEQVELASGAIATMQESEARALLAQCIESEVQLLDADRETRELRVRMLNEAIGDALRRLAASAGVSGSGAVGAGVAGGLLVKAIVKKLLASIAVKTTGKSAVKAVGSWKGAAAVAAALSPLGPVGTVVGGVLGAAGRVVGRGPSRGGSRRVFESGRPRARAGRTDRRATSGDRSGDVGRNRGESASIRRDVPAPSIR